MKCFLCKKSDLSNVYSLKNKTILRCKNDKLFLGATTANNKINVYGKEYFIYSPHLSNSSYFSKKLETIQLLTSNHKPHILDIGCGWGDFEEVLEQENIPYLGIDINKEAIKICRKKGLNCFNISLNELILSGVASDEAIREADLRSEGKSLTEEKSHERQNLTKMQFDAITMFQLIEHVKNPLSLLQSAQKLLKPGGVILITTPNNDTPLRKILGSRWSVYNEPSHYVFYNRNTLTKTFHLAGFNNIQVKLDQMRFLSSNYILKRLFQMYFNWKLNIGDWKFA